jgi:hypothetical protein
LETHAGGLGYNRNAGGGSGPPPVLKNSLQSFFHKSS